MEFDERKGEKDDGERERVQAAVACLCVSPERKRPNTFGTCWVTSHHPTYHYHASYSYLSIFINLFFLLIAALLHTVRFKLDCCFSNLYVLIIN